MINIFDKYTQMKKNTVVERILEPQGHLETADPISDDSKKNWVAPKKQMGNKTPLEAIAKILASIPDKSNKVT